MSQTSYQKRFTISEMAGANDTAAHYAAIHCYVSAFLKYSTFLPLHPSSVAARQEISLNDQF